MAVAPCNEPRNLELGDLEKLLKDVVRAQFELGREALRVVGDGAAILRDALPGIPGVSLKDCCAVPDACWMPLAAGTVECSLTADGRGEIHLVLTNGNPTARTFTLSAAGPDASMIQLPTTSMTLSAMERRRIDIPFVAPAAAGTHDAVLWVNGCRQHYLRVVVHVGEKQKACCFNVTIDDRPDNVVHWYDHFYCRKPCPTGR